MQDEVTYIPEVAFLGQESPVFIAAKWKETVQELFLNRVGNHTLALYIAESMQESVTEDWETNLKSTDHKNYHHSYLFGPIC